MSSYLTPPEPFEVEPPRSSSDNEPVVDRVLYVDKTGRLSFEGFEGEAALNALASAGEADNVIQVRADRAMEVIGMARLLSDLAKSGLTSVELVVASK